MILYHGSTQEIINPDVAFSRKNIDFGEGFYTTPIKQQAIDWAKRFKYSSKLAVLNFYEFDERYFKKFNTKEFDSYDQEWLDFIVANRTDKSTKRYDIVIGGIANDRVFNTIELLLENLIQKSEALGRLKYEEKNLQICFKEQEIIDKYLIFKKSEQI